MVNSNIKLDWKTDVKDVCFGIHDPWDSKEKNIRSDFKHSILLNWGFKSEQTFPELNLDTYFSMRYIITVLKSFFICEIPGYKQFLTDSNMVKFVKLYLHSLRHVNINFISSFSDFLDEDIISSDGNKVSDKAKLFRMLGIFIEYLIHPDYFEGVVVTEDNAYKQFISEDYTIKF